MYREDDEVYVFNGKGLIKNKMVITEVSDDEEQFTVNGVNDEEEEITLSVPRSHIMEEYEVDKLGVLLIEDKVWTLDKASDIDEVEAFQNGELSDYITVFFDETLDGIVMDITGSFSTVESFEEWFKTTFSHYSENGIYKLDGTYYVVIIG